MENEYPDNWEKLKGQNPPAEGWEEHTWYVLMVKMNSNNPPHKHLYFNGFSNGNYSGGFPTNYAPDGEDITRLGEYYYYEVIKKLDI